MSFDQETLAVYAGAARKYARGFAKPEDTIHNEDLDAFCALLPKGGHVLDLGCGPGHWSAKLKEQGFVVTATDASPEMVRLAKDDFAVQAHVSTFEDLADVGVFDGVWANFSLLHAPRKDLSKHLGRIHLALKPGGIFHIGMKLGNGEDRDDLGRFYAFYGEEELSKLLAEAGFTVTRSRRGNGKGLAGGIETFITQTAHA